MPAIKRGKAAKAGKKSLHKGKKLEETKAPLTFRFKLVAVKTIS